jgi:hypothetical protein
MKKLILECSSQDSRHFYKNWKILIGGEKGVSLSAKMGGNKTPKKKSPKHSSDSSFDVPSSNSTYKYLKWGFWSVFFIVTLYAAVWDTRWQLKVLAANTGNERSSVASTASNRRFDGGSDSSSTSNVPKKKSKGKSKPVSGEFMRPDATPNKKDREDDKKYSDLGKFSNAPTGNSKKNKVKEDVEVF